MSDGGGARVLLDLNYDCLELIMAHVAWGADRPPPPAVSEEENPRAAHAGSSNASPTTSDAAALAHPAAACACLRRAALAILARCSAVDLTPPRVCAAILLCRSGRRPSPDELGRAAPLVAALLARATGAATVDLAGGHAYVTDATLDALVAGRRAAPAAGAGRGAAALEGLRIDHCAWLSAAGLARLAAGAPRLRSLSAAGVPAAGEPGALAGLSALAHLDLSWVRGAGVAAPLHHGLVTARLRGCEAVGDAALRALLPAPGLRHLDIAFTAVTDAGLLAIAAGCPALVSLTVANSERCDEVWSLGYWSATGLRRFRTAAPGVTVELVSS